MLFRRAVAAERARQWFGPARDVGRKTTRHHQAHTPASALGKVLGQRGQVGGFVFQAGVHAAHEHAVLQGGETQVQRLKQVGVGVGCVHENMLKRHGPGG